MSKTGIHLQRLWLGFVIFTMFFGFTILAEEPTGQSGAETVEEPETKQQIVMEPVVTLSDSRVSMGEVLRIIVRAEEKAKVRLSFLRESKQLVQASAGTFYGLAAVTYYATPGEYPLVITVENGGGVWSRTYPILVEPRKFPEQRITVPKATAEKILTPANQAADAQKGKEIRSRGIEEPIPPLWEGTFLTPVKGRITAEFGLIRYVNDKENGRHSGWDFGAPTGTPVRAVNHGRVIFAGTMYQTGLTVVIHHGLDLYTSYAHLSVISVKDGATVRTGDLVGKVGATGLATGPHLHLTIRVGEIPVDPALLLEKSLTWEFARFAGSVKGKSKV